MSIAVLVLASVVLAQGQPRARPNVGPDQEHLKYEEGFRPTRSGYIVLMIPRPIQADEWRRYGEILQLSEAQQAALAEPFDLYRRADWAFRMDRAQSLWDRSAEIQARGDVGKNVQIARDLLALMDDAHALWPTIAGMESVFFAEVEGVLSEQQLPLLQIVKMRRERLVAQVVPAKFPCSWFDLDEIIFNMRARGIDITPIDAATFDGLVTEWRAGATNLHKRLSKLRRQLIIERTPFHAQINEMVARDGLTPEAYAFDAEHRRKGVPVTQAARDLLDFNKRYVELIAAQLPRTAANELTDQFNRAAYPALFPDSADMRVIFDAIAELPLEDEQARTITAIQAECESSSAAALDRMKDTYLAWKENTTTRSGFIFDEYFPYADEMTRMQDARIRNCMDAISAIEATLAPAEIEQIRDEFELWRGWLEAFRKRQKESMKQYQKWPAPYD